MVKQWYNWRMIMSQSWIHQGDIALGFCHYQEQSTNEHKLCFGAHNWLQSRLVVKKVLVFPQNESEMHWSFTFVFNAGSILDKFEAEDESKPSLQPCFFWYCSSIPDGSCIVDLDSGVLWYLNLCYSNEVLKQNLPELRTIVLLLNCRIVNMQYNVFQYFRSTIQYTAIL